LGDDDFILFDTCLKKLHAVIEKTKAGFIRLNLIDESLNSQTLQKKLLHFSFDFSIGAEQDPKSIFLFLDKLSVGMLTGIVLRNTRWVKQNLLHTENSAWFPLICQTVKHYGGYFVSDIYVVIHWSVPNIGSTYEAYKVRNSVLDLEPLLNYCLKNAEYQDKGTVNKLVLSKYIPNIPSIKLYTDNGNCLRFVFRLCVLEHSFAYDLRLWILLLCSLILPKKSLVFIRSLQHSTIDMFYAVPNKKKIYQRYMYLKKKYYLLVDC
jgi:hypothetical protein